jgi:hypothetical protein
MSRITLIIAGVAATLLLAVSAVFEDARCRAPKM